MVEGEITIVVKGKSHTGQYVVDGASLQVCNGSGSKRAVIGNMPIKVLARLLLRELVVGITR